MTPNKISDKQWLPAIERAQYEADRTERQFMLADPENRLVVRSLETNWNQKLKELEKAKQDYAVYSSKRPLDSFRSGRAKHPEPRSHGFLKYGMRHPSTP